MERGGRSTAGVLLQGLAVNLPHPMSHDSLQRLVRDLSLITPELHVSTDVFATSSTTSTTRRKRPSTPVSRRGRYNVPPPVYASRNL